MKKQILAVLGAAVLLAACEGDINQNVDVGSAPQPGSAEDFRRNVKDRVFFAYNKSNLSSEAKKNLDSQVQWLKTYENTNVVVKGHCDERGTREFNQALGAKRASSVKKHLTTHGVKKSRVETISFGKDNPPVAGTGEAVWAQNRVAVTEVK